MVKNFLYCPYKLDFISYLVTSYHTVFDRLYHIVFCHFLSYSFVQIVSYAIEWYGMVWYVIVLYRSSRTVFLRII